MGLMPYLVAAALNLLVMAMDIAFVLLLVRILRQWSTNKMLAAFDTAGEPIVNWLSALSERLWRALSMGRPLSDRGKVLVAMLVLVVLRPFVTLLLVLLR